MIEKKIYMITMLALALLLLVGKEMLQNIKHLLIWTFWLFFCCFFGLFLRSFSLSQVATEISSDSDYNFV